MALFVGTSLGKCIASILDGTVKEDEVFVIVTNTYAPSIDALLDVVEEYYYRRNIPKSYDLSKHSLLACKELVTRLYNSGKIHQPRTLLNEQSHSAHTLKDTWYDIIPTDTTGDENVVQAFERYRLLSALLK